MTHEISMIKPIN